MQNNERTSFTAAILNAIDFRLNSVHTCLPGSIEKYDYKKAKANVKPLIKKANGDGTFTELPVIPDVPVVFPRTSEMIFHFPLKRGDGVLLVFCERSIDNWVDRGTDSNPGNRSFSLSDAIAIPGLFSFAANTGAKDNDSLYIKYKNGSIKIDKRGKIDLNDGNLTVEV